MRTQVGPGTWLGRRTKTGKDETKRALKRTMTRNFDIGRGKRSRKRSVVKATASKEREKKRRLLHVGCRDPMGNPQIDTIARNITYVLH
jgi:hypothetical protein